MSLSLTTATDRYAYGHLSIGTASTELALPPAPDAVHVDLDWQRCN